MLLEKKSTDTVILNEVLSQVREEFDEHLESINDNTSEIHQNFSCLSELDEKLDKLSERLESLELFLEKKHGFDNKSKPKFQIKSLTEKEKAIFLTLYTLENEQKPTTYRQIQINTGLPKTLIQGYITSLIEKGVPITKAYINNIIHLKMDQQFKAEQAKHNIVKLEQKTLNHML